MSTILVTGAKGTVGGYAVGLAEAAGHRVIVSDRDARGLRAPIRGEVRAADIANGSPLDALMRGVDIVIHTAAQLSVSADATELARTNTDAVEALYEAATRNGVSRFVHLSTATLYERSAGSEGLREDARLAPTGPYSLSKHGAEAFLRGKRDGGGPAWTILRAAPIYGRRGRHFAASLLAFAPIVRLATPILPRVTSGPLGTMVHAEDVARAALFVGTHADTRFEAFNVSDGDAMTLGARLDATVDAYGLDASDRVQVPDSVFRAFAGWFSGARAHATADRAALAAWSVVVARHGLKPALRPHLDREVIPLLSEPLVIDANKLGQLGFKPRFSSFDAGFRETLRWYQSERWVPRYG